MGINDEIPPSGVLSQKGVNQVVKGEDTIEDFLSKMISLSDAGIFYEHSCPICVNSNRQKAEKQWLDSRNAEEVRQFFKDHGDSYTIPVIKNHMEGHLDQSQTELRKREYVDKLLVISSSSVTTLSRLEVAITALNERLLAMNAVQDPSVSILTVEKTRSEVSCKIVATIEKMLQFRAKLLGEMKNTGEVFTINKNSFVNLFTKLISESKSDEETRIINIVFTELNNIAQEF